MRRVPRRLSRLAAAALLMALACSSPPDAPMPGAEPASPFAGLRRFFEPPPEGQALVLFFRPPRRGRTGWATVYEDDRILALFGYKSYLVHLTPPGSYRYMIVGEAADFMDAELEASRVYFAELVPRTGAWRARFSLVPYPPGHPRLDKLEAWLAKSQTIHPGLREEEWHASHWESVAGKRDAYLPKWLGKVDRPTLNEGLDSALLE